MGCHIEDLSKRWPLSGIPFMVNPAVSAALLLVIQNAITAWNAVTMIPFVARQTEADFVSFVEGAACVSPVARNGGSQIISCVSFGVLSNILHEMGHAAGLFHEQSRSDRAESVGIHWSNIQPDQRHNFEIATGSRNVGSYDFDSVMHYGRNFFAYDNHEPTIFFPQTATSPGATLSSGDITTLAALYTATHFAQQTGTALPETDATFEFCIALNDDIFAIKKSNTESNSTEVHILSATSGYEQFALQIGTPLPETDSTFQFCLANNRDLVAIKKSNTGTNSTEIHILSAASGYQQFALQTGTALQNTDHTFEFCFASNRDLFAIKKSNTASNSTEVHILSVASGYQQFTLQTGTALPTTDATFEFCLALNRDLFAIKKSGTGTHRTEVHVLSEASGYLNFSAQTGTLLHETDDTFAFDLTTNRDLVAIRKSDTGTNSTEVHIINLPL